MLGAHLQKRGVNVPLKSRPDHSSVGRIAGALSAAMLLVACSGSEKLVPRAMTESLKADLQVVASSRVYFGHQSVGGNIMDGLADLQSQLPEPTVRVGELGSLDISGDQPVLLHTAIGENSKPVSKCQDFRRILATRLDGRVDVALFKFCYIDFNDRTDVRSVFETYSTTMNELKLKYPGIVFIHVTAPLRSIDRGLGVWVREMLGRTNRTKLANVRRNEFNRLLRETYPDEPVFDLEAAMSTYPDGRRETFSMDGTVYYSLVPAYTDDGGHLNSVGRTHAAADLVHSIADAVRAHGRHLDSTPTA